MKVTLKIALRNLFRQKRRNILLGIGIAFGMMILVMTDSFTNGITDIILNDVIVNMTGHAQVYQEENVDGTADIIRDKDHVIGIITNTLDNVDHIRENVGAMARVVGNGAGDMMMIAGMPDEAMDYFFTLNILEGDPTDMTNDNYSNPCIIYSGKAKTLNLSAYDTLKAKFYTVSGQIQSARFTVVAILESDNEFVDMVGYAKLGPLKELMGYEPHETQNLNIILERIRNPYMTLLATDKLHEALKPHIAVVYGDFSDSISGSLLAYETNLTVLSNLADRLDIDLQTALEISEEEQRIYLGSDIAAKEGVGTGDSVTFSYETRFEDAPHEETFVVAGVYEGSADMPADTAMINEIDLYQFYFEHLPPLLENMPEAFMPSEESEWSDDLALEYILLDQTVDFPELEGLPERQQLALLPRLINQWKAENQTTFTEEFNDKWREFNRTKWNGSAMDVISMQEIADQFLQIEQGLDSVSLVIVLILFFIILVGVVNSLRMSIRERTREIGTIRAIGMQSKLVRRTFILETLMLTFFAGIVGIIAGLILTGILSLPTFQAEGLMALLLSDGHLHFIVEAGKIIRYLFIIMIITLITAYFPARRAAKLTVANALRHYE